MECLCGSLDDLVSSGVARRSAARLAVPQGHGKLGRGFARSRHDFSLHVDVYEQVDQVAGSLYPLSRGCIPSPGLDSLRLFPRSHQDVCCDDFECGKCLFTLVFLLGLLVGFILVFVYPSVFLFEPLPLFSSKFACLSVSLPPHLFSFILYGSQR